MSYRAYHDYDDDRDVITCVTLSDRPVARKEHTCGGVRGGDFGGPRRDHPGRASPLRLLDVVKLSVDVRQFGCQTPQLVCDG